MVQAVGCLGCSLAQAVRITLTLATQDSVGTTGSATAAVSRTVPITVGIKRRML